MALSLGYLLPTRERIMEEQHVAVPAFALADRAQQLGLGLGPRLGAHQAASRPADHDCKACGDCVSLEREWHEI